MASRFRASVKPRLKSRSLPSQSSSRATSHPRSTPSSAWLSKHRTTPFRPRTDAGAHERLPSSESAVAWHEPTDDRWGPIPSSSKDKDPALESLQREPTPAEWAAHRTRLKSLYPEGWNPPKKMSREAMDALRRFHAENSSIANTALLADKFKISPEAVRRILKSKWRPGPEKMRLIRKQEHEAREEARRLGMEGEEEEMVGVRWRARSEASYEADLERAARNAKAWLDGQSGGSEAELKGGEERIEEDEEDEGNLRARPPRKHEEEADDKPARPRKETVEDRLRKARARAAAEEAATAAELSAASAKHAAETIKLERFLRRPVQDPPSPSLRLPTLVRPSEPIVISSGTVDDRIRLAKLVKAEEQRSSSVKARWEKRLQEEAALRMARRRPLEDADRILQTSRMGSLFRIAKS